MVGSCEHGNEHSGSIKCREFLAEQLLRSQVGLCSIDLVNFNNNLPNLMAQHSNSPTYSA
jgi:hypothetical protein